jgi:hypothetical protein
MKTIYDLKVVSNKFNLIANEINIDNDDEQIKICFSNAIANDVYNIYEFITEILPQSNSKPKKIILELKNTNIIMSHQNNLFELKIKNVFAEISEKIITNFISDIYFNNLLIGKLNAQQITPENVVLNFFKLFVDPHVIDKLYTLFFNQKQSEINNSNVAIPENIMEELEDALNCSFMAESIKHFIEQTTFNLVKTNDNLCFDNLCIQCNVFNLCLYDEITQNKKSPFVYSELKNISISKKSKKIMPHSDTPCLKVDGNNMYYQSNQDEIIISYNFKMETGKIIDTKYSNKWSTFVKFSNTNAVNLSFDISNGETIRIVVAIEPIIANIREETVVHLLSFMPFAQKSNKQIFIDLFEIANIEIILNYYPIIVEQLANDMLSIKDFKINLKKHTFVSIDNFDKLITILTNKWKEDISISNVVQFIPNINAIHPYTVYIIDAIKMISYYTKNKKNKKIIYSITTNIKNGGTISGIIVSKGVKKIWHLFV